VNDPFQVLGLAADSDDENDSPAVSRTGPPISARTGAREICRRPRGLRRASRPRNSPEQPALSTRHGREHRRAYRGIAMWEPRRRVPLESLLTTIKKP